jgi:hypothetical protein
VNRRFDIGDLVHFKINNAYFGLCVVTGYGKSSFKEGQYIVVNCASGEVYVAFDYELYSVEEFGI